MSGSSPLHNLPVDDSPIPGEQIRGASLIGAVPLVGRDAELARANTRIRAGLAGQFSIVAVTGEPGIGKTRFARSIAAQEWPEPGATLWARGLEDDWQPQYQVWDEILDQAIAAAGTPAPVEAAPTWVAPLLPIVPHLTTVYPEVVPLAHLSTQEEQFRVTDAIVRCLCDLAQRMPMLIVLDDLQWIDPQSLRVLRRLGTSAGAARLAIVTTIRSDVLEQTPQLADLVSQLRRESAFEEIVLRGLSYQHVGELMQMVGNGPFPPDLVRLMLDVTRGNPFFVQEMTRHLVEGAGERESGGGEGAPSAGRLAVPESLRQVVEQRLGRLTDRTQRMLRLAAVCTSGFDFPMLRALTSLGEEDLLDAIDEALTARLIVPLDPAGDRYDFLHQLVQRALYDTWGPSRRVRLHRALAVSLEHIHGETAYVHAGQIAAHYHISRQVPGVEAGVPFALAAAEQAGRRFAPEQVAANLRMARDMAVALPVTNRAAILQALALAEANALWLESSLATIEDALHAMREALSDAGEQARFIAAAVTSLHDGGASTELWSPLLYEGLALVPANDEVTWARLTLLIERFEPLAVGIVNGSRWLGSDLRAVEIARASGDEDLFARSLQPWDLWSREWTEQLSGQIATWHTPGAIIRALTVCGADWLYHHGEFRRAKAHFENLLSIAERQRSIPGQAEAMVRLGIIQVALGDLPAARAWHGRATALVDRLGAGHRLHASLWWLRAFLAEFDTGEWSEVATWFPSYIADPRVGRTTIAFDDAALAAYALTRAGEHDQARLLLGPLIQILDQLEPSLWLLNGTVGFGAAAVWTLQADDLAPPLYHAALAAMDAGHDDFPCSSMFLSVARLAALMGNTGEAHTWFDRARSHLDASGQQGVRGIVDLDEATMLATGTFGDQHTAQQLAASARQRFVDIGATPWTQAAATLQETLAARVQDPRRVPAGLTQRELDVIRLVARGYSDRQIGDDIFVSPRTVNAHIRNILAKTQVRNRTELSIWAVEHGVVRPNT